MKKIFIAGPRAIKRLDSKVLLKLKNMKDNNYIINVGDANGVDKLIQEFYDNLNYHNVNVFASNGKARNNLGNWTVNEVNVENSVKGFEFYAQKDKAMAEQSDLGFMIWNGKSKGTLNNIINLRKENKYIIVYLTILKDFYEIKTDKNLLDMIKICPNETKQLYLSLTKEKLVDKDNMEQLSMII